MGETPIGEYGYELAKNPRFGNDTGNPALLAVFEQLTLRYVRSTFRGKDS